ncbi:MAG: response regulator [bacterium]|nr:response regulator [bacterium]
MIKVFLVEDEIIIRESIQKMIPWSEYGYELVGEATDGEMALPMIKEKRPDVLITDIKMPFMDGLTLSKLVKKELPEMKIVIISGYDDFTYAQTAIALGVEQYLLKPISKNKFISILEEIRNAYTKENEQKMYYEKFKQEKQEYEQHSRQDFFETIVRGELPLPELYAKADKLAIDIMAESYIVLLFSMNSMEDETAVLDGYSEDMATMQQDMEQYFQAKKDYILFRYQIFSYAVVIKGKKDKVEQLSKECIKELQSLFSRSKEKVDWFICTGKPVDRLSKLNESYQCAIKSFAFRYMEDRKVIEYGEQVESPYKENETIDMEGIDIDALNPDIIRNFLNNGLFEETKSFVHNYLSLIGEGALRSRMFRQYVLLNIHFNIVSFLQKLGEVKEAEQEKQEGIAMDSLISFQDMEQFLEQRINHTIALREEKSRNQYKNMIETAVEYINQHYMEEEISLNKVACVANVSANHFSALFSQQMKQTFVEYLTEIRMKKAKELLRCTNMRSGRIALEVGYKDAHYFSFLFKKTQKMTPSEYRNGREKSL